MTGLADVVVIGGGIAGGALATVLARAGVSVLLLERTIEYRDRVRGEWLSPWGVVEAQRLKLYDTLRAAGGHHVPRFIAWDETVDAAQAEAEALDLGALFPGVSGALCLGHPVACRALVQAAASAGATVLHGVSGVRVTAGDAPEVSYRHADVEHRVRCRLVVGADARGSAVREQAGIRLYTDPPHHLFSGLLVANLDWPDDIQTVGTEGDVNFLVFPQAGGKARLYLGHALADRHRFTGPEGTARFLAAFRLSCVPESDRLARATPAGPCAGYTNEDTWTEEPFADGVVLIGDAAGHNDPIIGQGLSIALRDVRLVSELLLATREWSTGLFAPYSAERRERMRRLRFTAALTATLTAEFGTAATERRRRANDRMRADSTLQVAQAVPFIGPEAAPAELFTEETWERILGPA